MNLEDKMTTDAITDKFKAAWWLPDGHSQTLWRKFSTTKTVHQRRQRVELDDGDFIDVDWADAVSVNESKEKTIVFILHGLCGCSSSPYILDLQALLNENGIASMAMNFRGCSGEINRLARAYHSGVSEDLEEVFAKILAQYPKHNFVFVGYSLGANVLLKWLGEIKGHPNIKKAIAVSTPFSLRNCSSAMLRGASQLYGKYFVRRLVADFSLKKSHFENISEPTQAEHIGSLGDTRNISSIWEFDDKVTAPLHGYADAEDYYDKCSSLGFLDAIGSDTLLIQSLNDPLIPRSSIPDKSSLAANVRLLLSHKGGHVGFISGSRQNWLEQKILSFIQA